MGATIARVLPAQERLGAQGRTDVRVRWRMGREARGLTLITFALLCFGLAVLYSASAILAMNDGQPSTYYLGRQLAGAVAGLLAFAIAAKSDAERWHGWAWPLMWFTIATMFLTLVLPESVAPRINGSKRFLFGASFQPSELGKLAVVVWCAMLVIKKGETLRRLTKGLLPFLLVVAVLCVLAALQPDLSVAMLYTLLMGVVLFAGGARMGHFIALGALAFPLLWTQIEKVHYAFLRLTSFFDPGAAPREAGGARRDAGAGAFRRDAGTGAARNFLFAGPRGVCQRGGQIGLRKIYPAVCAFYHGYRLRRQINYRWTAHYGPKPEPTGPRAQ